jgi:hypothetical protein
MGQKANLITLRNVESTLTVVEENSKFVINIIEFFNTLNLFLQHRKIWIFKTRFNGITNVCNISFELFYLTTKSLAYKKKLKGGDKNSLMVDIKFQKKIYEKKMAFFFSFFFKQLKKNFYTLSFLVLNSKVKVPLLSKIYFKTRWFLKTLFDRRFNLYLDFLKVFSLMCQGLVHVSSFLFILSHVLRFLTKRSHGKFIEFVKLLLDTAVVNSENQSIKGIKFIINGKLKGQARASSFNVLSGTVVRQSISKNIEFSTIHTNTRIGVFGMRVWLCRQ